MSVEARYEAGLELLRRGEWFAAHEELELAWRAAAPAERDFFQGLVHVAVAWYQAGRGRRIGCERQLEKAARRLGPYAPRHRGLDLGPYAPRHRGLDLDPVLAAVANARARLEDGLPRDEAMLAALRR